MREKRRARKVPGKGAARRPAAAAAVAARAVTAMPSRAARPLRSLPSGYAQFLAGLRVRIRAAQVKAALAVNRELVELYWHVGQSIVERQRTEGWGMKVIDRLADDLRAEFPTVGGFSRSNVYRMRTFYLAYDGEEVVAQPVRQLAGRRGGKNGRGSDGAIVAQPVRQLAVLPRGVAEIPWGHNVVLFEKVKGRAERIWYAEQTTAQGWSRAVLVQQIESRLYHRSGKAVTNFATTLTSPESDLVQQLIKDPYNFEFLTLGPEARERDLQRGLVEHLKKFLLELGVGFAFVGQEYRVEVGGDDFYVDLIFYHLRLRRYVVIDLKVEEFRPEHAGKMNFYLSAVDDQFRHGDDQSSVGLILCKTRNNLVAEYALRDVGKPMGVATYSAKLPPALRGSLPSPERIARELNAARHQRSRRGEDRGLIHTHGRDHG